METYLKDKLRKNLETLIDVKGKKLLLMLSGGADSMVLLHFLMELKSELGFELAAFSLDHMFRGEASYQDLLFVKEESEKRNLKLHAYRRDVAARARELGIGDELCARLTRYHLAESLRQCYGYDYILSAHHRSDAAESLLLHFIRGSGLGGLKGIRELDGAILRPLLFASKAEILKAAKELSIPFREDETNSENTYSRNYLRNEIIPRLENLNPNLEASLMRTADIIAEEDAYLELLAKEKIEELKLPCGDEGLKLKLEELRTCHLALKRRLILHILRASLGKVDVYSTIVEEILKLLSLGTGKKVEFRGLVFELEREALIIRRLKLRDDLGIYKLCYGKKRLPSLILDCQKAKISKGKILLEDGLFDPKREVKLLDYLVLAEEEYEGGLVIRKREAEDSMRPARLKGKSRKIKKLLNDHKLPAYQREELLYLANSFEVLWILGIEKTYVHTQLLTDKDIDKNIVLIRAYSL